MTDFDKLIPPTDASPPSARETYEQLRLYYKWAQEFRELHARTLLERFRQLGYDGNDTREASSGIKDRIIAEMSEDDHNRLLGLLAHWIGALQVVVEGWEELNFSDSAIDSLLDNPDKRQILKRARHGAFHFQRSLRASQFRDFYSALDQVGPWAQELDLELGRYFLQTDPPN